MDIHHDFGPDAADPTLPGRERRERLLACFQQALGHELPNQLVALQGLARMLDLEQGDRLDADGRGRLLRLADLARGADRLVRSLAEIGRLCRDPGPREAVCLAEAAREAAAEVNLLSPGQRVEYHFQEPSPVLTVSPRGLRHVLVQLIRNAAQAAVPGRALHVEVGGRRETAGVAWWVKDDGRGLSEAEAPNLFEPFVGGDGAGLGLFLVRQVVAGWGGSVRVQSEPGRGATFTVFVRDP
jgi:signal transduction histidine kinase